MIIIKIPRENVQELPFEMKARAHIKKSFSNILARKLTIVVLRKDIPGLYPLHNAYLNLSTWMGEGKPFSPAYHDQNFKWQER